MKSKYREISSPGVFTGVADTVVLNALLMVIPIEGVPDYSL